MFSHYYGDVNTLAKGHQSPPLRESSCRPSNHSNQLGLGSGGTLSTTCFNNSILFGKQIKHTHTSQQ